MRGREVKSFAGVSQQFEALFQQAEREVQLRRRLFALGDEPAQFRHFLPQRGIARHLLLDIGPPVAAEHTIDIRGDEFIAEFFGVGGRLFNCGFFMENAAHLAHGVHILCETAARFRAFLHTFAQSPGVFIKGLVVGDGECQLDQFFSRGPVHD